MRYSTILFAGAGDLAARTLEQCASLNVSQSQAFTLRTIAIARSVKPMACDEFWQGQLQDDAILQRIVDACPDVIVVTLVPNGKGEVGYQKGYIEPLLALLNKLKTSSKHRPAIIFASSTGVYHQQNGEWVDEQTVLTPASFSGQKMQLAEQMLSDSHLPYCAVRFGGIYGDGRDFLIRQVQAGKGGGPEYTNRIHQDDAARCLAMLIQRFITDQKVPECLIACDSEPAASSEVRAFIAQQLQLSIDDLESSSSGRGGNKRCSNKALLELGFELAYPSYKDGYAHLSVSER